MNFVTRFRKIVTIERGGIYVSLYRMVDFVCYVDSIVVSRSIPLPVLLCRLVSRQEV